MWWIFSEMGPKNPKHLDRLPPTVRSWFSSRPNRQSSRTDVQHSRLQSETVLFFCFFFPRRNTSKTLNWWNISRVDGTLILIYSRRGRCAPSGRLGCKVAMQTATKSAERERKRESGRDVWKKERKWERRVKERKREKVRERKFYVWPLWFDLCDGRILKAFYTLFSKTLWLSSLPDTKGWFLTVSHERRPLWCNLWSWLKDLRQVQGQLPSQPCMWPKIVCHQFSLYQKFLHDFLGRLSDSVTSLWPMTVNSQLKRSTRWHTDTWNLSFGWQGPF